MCSHPGYILIPCFFHEVIGEGKLPDRTNEICYSVTSQVVQDYQWIEYPVGGQTVELS